MRKWVCCFLICMLAFVSLANAQYAGSPPMPDKYLMPDGSIQSFSGVVYAPADVKRANIYKQSSWNVAKWLLPDGSIASALPFSGGSGSGNVATDTIFDAAGDLIQGSGANAGERLAVGTAYQVLHSDGTKAAWTSTLGATGTRLTYGYFIDLVVTNAIQGSVTGNAGGLSGTPNITVGTISAGATGFSVDADGDTTAKSITVTKSSGVAGLMSLYEANSTDTSYIGFMGPASISESYSFQFSNSQPSAGQVMAFAAPTGTGDPNGNKVSAQTWVTPLTTATTSIALTGNLTGLLPAIVITTASGVHDGADDAATLTDSGESFTTSQFVGMTLYNITDGSSCTVTANNATTVTCTLAGGTGNDWDTNDVWQVGPGPSQSGSWIYVVAASTIRHPATAGYTACYESDATAVLTVDMASDSMIFQGVLDTAVTALDAGDSIDSSGSTTGDFQCIHNKSATEAQGKGKRGTWADGGAT